MTLSVDLFFSFRSPYSYLALPKTRKLVADHDVTLNLRPVYPLVPNAPIDEWEAKALSGFEGHAPVRVGNAAAEQVAGNEKTSRSELAGMKHAVDSTGR
mgnify:CR=1 FL=1